MIEEQYSKLYKSITTSTVWMQPDAVRLVWITMLAVKDKSGIVWASLPGLAHLARVSLEGASQAIEVLSAPDPYSRTPDFEGRRIESIEGGWCVLNHAKYRAVRDPEVRAEQNREAQARYKAARRKVSQSKPESATVSQSKPESATVSQSKPESAHTDTDTDTDTDEEAEVREEKSAPDGAMHADHADDPRLIFDRLKTIYPQRDGSQRWADAAKHFQARLREGATAREIEDGVMRYAKYCHARGLTGTDKVQQAATFLGTNRGYAEPWEVVRKPVLVKTGPSAGGVYL